MQAKLSLNLRDVLDWAYCPLRFWWRNTGLAPDISDIHGKKTGEELFRIAVQRAIKLYYDSHGNGHNPGFAGCIGHVWRTWLDNWDLSKVLAAPLIEYHKRRRSLLSRFERGAITKRDGDLYKRPMWTRHWEELANSTGLTNLRKIIDNHQTKIGMGTLDVSREDSFNAPIGLADAFANSLDIAGGIELPNPVNVLGVEEPMIVDLPSVMLNCRADIVVELGKSRRVGRPSDKPGTNNEITKLECIILLYDDAIPSIYSLAKDLRVLSFGQATLHPSSYPGQNSKVVTVTVYHLPTGTRQEFRPQLGDGAEALESLSRAVCSGIRGGAYVPRMVCGWKACGDCEYRNLCFTEEGVMATFNPPLMAQIHASEDLRVEMLKFLNGKKSEESRINMLRSFIEFSGRPGYSPEGATWMLENLIAEQRL